MLTGTKTILLLDVFDQIKIKDVFELIKMDGLSNKIIIMKFLCNFSAVNLSSSDSIIFRDALLWASEAFFF